MSKESSAEVPEKTPEQLLPLNEFELFLEGRRQAVDGMMWQVPGLSIAAQAFLYVVALNPRSSDWVRMFAGVLGFVAALATIQLLTKHRYHEQTFSEMIDVSRRSRGATPLRGSDWLKERALHEAEALEAEVGTPLGYVKRYRDGPLKHRLISRSSVSVWNWTLGMFCAGNALIVIAAAIDQVGLFHPFS